MSSYHSPSLSAAQLGDLLPADGRVVRAVQEVRQFLSPHQLHEPLTTPAKIGGVGKVLGGRGTNGDDVHRILKKIIGTGGC